MSCRMMAVVVNTASAINIQAASPVGWQRELQLHGKNLKRIDQSEQVLMHLHV